MLATMIVLLHKVEAPHTMQLLYTFGKFASVRLDKPSLKLGLAITFSMSNYELNDECQSQSSLAAQARQITLQVGECRVATARETLSN
ncbi:hypothetical protein BJY01DRAFT_205777 [Aspergillus pseudoustus]|uniref:Uncharacterized protein n=1 Tax=Aspergillus pseudoustus TaxID=1810923 RepID=A0ABR4KPQ7_9EURO